MTLNDTRIRRRKKVTKTFFCDLFTRQVKILENSLFYAGTYTEMIAIILAKDVLKSDSSVRHQMDVSSRSNGRAEICGRQVGAR
jgi:hypothetical protein